MGPGVYIFFLQSSVGDSKVKPTLRRIIIRNVFGITARLKEKKTILASKYLILTA